jgi:hypothetical protein
MIAMRRLSGRPGVRQAIDSHLLPSNGALQECRPQSLRRHVDLYLRVVQDIRDGARVAYICTTLTAGIRDSEGSTTAGMKAVSGWLAEGRRGEVEARYGEPSCQYKKLCQQMTLIPILA